MTYENSLTLTARVGKIIAECQPRVAYTPADLAKAKRAFSEAELDELRTLRLYDGDFETFYVIRRFLEDYGIAAAADGAYLAGVFANAKRLDADAFLSDPYLETFARPVEARRGNFLLTSAEYRKGELFLYDMPDLAAPMVLPKLGFFSRRVSFPALYEGDMPWVSACPSELFSMGPDVPAARGRVLVLGLGIGWYPFAIADKPEVSEIVIVEHAPEVISLFETYLLPRFPHREKIRVVEADAFAYLAALAPGRFDFCYADIWEGAVDGAACYQKIKPLADRLPGTVFRYWIEKEILAYLQTDSP